MADDAELLQRWRAGDAAAGNQLFQRCFAPMFRFFVNKTRSLADTEELTQRTFVALMSARESFLGRSAFLRYALGVAHTTLESYYRSLARGAGARELWTSSIAALGAGARTLVECAEAQRRLLVALREIPAELQVVLELGYVEAFDPEAIGETLNIPVSAVHDRIERGRAALRARLDDPTAPDDPPPPYDEDWAELIRTAFPARILSTAFLADD